MEGDLFTFSQGLQLLNRGRAAQVEGDHHRLVSVASRQQCELHRRGRLARALQTGEHLHWRRSWGLPNAVGYGAWHFEERGGDRVDDLLRRGGARQHPPACESLWY